MKYGLPREEKPKKKWKAAMENELKCLKMEVCVLRNQLDEATNKIIELSSKQSAPFSFTQGSPRIKNPHLQSSQSVNNQFSSTKGSFPSNVNVNNDQRILTGVFESSQGNPFAPIERPLYESTWDYDNVTKKAVRLHSITFMPSYQDNKSFEELRYEDYVLKGIGFSNQIQRFFKLRSSKAETKNFSFTQTNWKPCERKNTDEIEEYQTKADGYQRFFIPWYLTPKPPKPWPFGPSAEWKKTSTLPVSDNVASGEPNTSDDKNAEVVQIKSVPFSTTRKHLATQTICNYDTKNNSNTRLSHDKTLSSQVLSELRKMTEQISTVHDYLLKMDSNLSDVSSQVTAMDSRLSVLDSNLSDVSSRVSVMDSRLSAVDMFVTMQRFDKKWQDLETRLVGLETSPPATAVSLLTNDSVNKDIRKGLHSSKPTITPKDSIIPTEKMDKLSQYCVENIENTQTSRLGTLNTSTPTSIKTEEESLPSMDTSDLNLSDFVRSISCTDTAIGSKSFNSSQLDDSIVSPSPSKIKIVNASFEMADLKVLHSMPSTSLENSGLQENESLISYSESGCSISTKINDSTQHEKGGPNNDKDKIANKVDEAAETSEENKLAYQSELQIKAFVKDTNKGTISNDPLGVTEQKNTCMSDDLQTIEDEFYIVEKSDVEESLEENLNTNTNEEASSSDLKMYNDITEYLEINLEKKKNLVYEFGFEAKPDYLPDCEESSDYGKKSEVIHEKKIVMSSADESFQQFKTNFIGHKSVDAKQSSPFVFYFSNSPEDPQDTKDTKKKKIIKALRTNKVTHV